MRRIIIMAIISAVIVTVALGVLFGRGASTAQGSPSAALGQTLGRVIPITQNHAGPLATVFVPTSDCVRLDVFLTASGGTSSVDVYPSIDGVTAFTTTPYLIFNEPNGPGNESTGATLNSAGASAATTTFGLDSFAGVGYGGLAGAGAPFVGVDIGGGVSGSVTSSVWLYCRFASSAATSVGGVAEQPNLPAAVGHGMSYTPALLLIAAAGIFGAGWYVRRKWAV